MAKTKKVVTELDKSIIRELKKNRVFSKTNTTNISNMGDGELFDLVVATVNNLTDDEIIIYICDQMYLDGDINLLLHVVDTKVVIVHRPEVYLKLKDYGFTEGKATLKFYDRL